MDSETLISIKKLNDLVSGKGYFKVYDYGNGQLNILNVGKIKNIIIDDETVWLYPKTIFNLTNNGRWVRVKKLSPWKCFSEDGTTSLSNISRSRNCPICIFTNQLICNIAVYVDKDNLCRNNPKVSFPKM